MKRPDFTFTAAPAAVFLLSLALASSAFAFPPAPYHTVHGMVRDEQGRPLSPQEGTIHLLGQNGSHIVYSPVDGDSAPGENYRLRVPIDSATDSRLYQINALRPALPFTMRVVIGGVSLVPIQMTARSWEMGKASASTRLDLTLGVDSDGDGLPDSWERKLIDTDPSGNLKILSDVKPGDDLDGDGMTNLQEYLVGTYALENLDSLGLEILSVGNGSVQLRFAAVTGHTYRLKSSSDLRIWTNEPFAFAPGGEMNGFWRATDVRLVDAYVTAGTAPGKSFRLYVD